MNPPEALRQAPHPSPLPLRGIFFDLDDTLIGYADAERAALTASCLRAAKIIPEIRPAALARAIYDVYKTGFAYGTPGYQALANLSIDEFRRCLTTAALERQGIAPEEALVAELVAAYGAAETEALRAFPEAAETLERLRQHFRLGIITNGPSALQRGKLAALALDGLFETIIVDTEFGHPKPDPRIFDYAARTMELPTASLLFVGNSLAYDVTGARRAGWISVWMNPFGQPLPSHFQPPNAATPDYIIHHLSDLLSLPPVASVLPLRALRSASAPPPPLPALPVGAPATGVGRAALSNDLRI